MTFTQKTTAKDPEAHVAAFNVDPRGYFYGNKRYDVTLESVEAGETKTGRKRFTIRFTERAAA